MVSSFNFWEGRSSEVCKFVLLFREDVIQQIDEIQKKKSKRKLQRNHLSLSYKIKKKTEEVSENGEEDCG